MVYQVSCGTVQSVAGGGPDLPEFCAVLEDVRQSDLAAEDVLHSRDNIRPTIHLLNLP